ncbi:MAG: 1-acyl-sn-glycerol-3-phosphate acyltransferase [Prolixibacteraceae bacterium]|nr:1-acyl-sn-glycerol-3-phosphate acyltransferase [Prolixibacteraceae bacterium]
MMEYNFEDIRPYDDNEVKDKIKLLIKDPVFDKVLRHMFRSGLRVRLVKLRLGMMRSTEQLQKKFVYKLLQWIVDKTSEGLTGTGLEKLEKEKAYLFISNHRDIILDSAIINMLIVEKGMNTTQIAIGNNLLLYEWIEHAVKLNRAFIIKRNLPPRELMEASLKVSHYIRKSITKDNYSVWIAQKEGRTKDGDDKTQISLLKMLNMSNKKTFHEGFNELNIVPVSISYEIEPCSMAKIKELIKKEYYRLSKTSKDDLKSMSMGIFNSKGRMHFAFGTPVKINRSSSGKSKHTNLYFKELAMQIDRQIYANYKLWPNNYIAYDILTQKFNYKDRYSPLAKKNFEAMIEEAIANIDFPVNDVKDRFLKIYANPVINKLKNTENDDLWIQ